ncbi:MAG TPA: DUF4097 family beta strand repeat-containing protein [Bryobacteraceae bacterium]|nr:DUF4097 family beta strand repeat-containing protein [Bryobacteraceae bacterium]
MPKTSLFILLGSLPVLAFQNPVPKLACNDRGFQHDSLVNHCEMREQTLAAPRGAIQINPGSNGGVTVNGWDRADMLVRARIDTAADTDSDARAIVSQIQIASGGGSIEATGPQTDHQHQWSVSYEIFAPRQSDIQAKAHNGGIRLTDLRGNIQFDTVNGGVTLARLAGDVHGQTTNGGLTVELAGDRWDGRGLDVTTTNGGVKLDVPSNYSAHFETATVNGGLKVDFPTVQGRVNKEMSFDIGQGGATIKVTTTNGGVKITRS